MAAELIQKEIKNRLIEFDILKFIAIFFIVFGHIDNYLSDPGYIRTSGGYLVLVGLSFFFFASGYTLSIHYNCFEKLSDFFLFYKRRCIRIFPLYLLSLVTIIMVFGFLSISAGNWKPYDLSPLNMIVHIFALQALLPDFSLQALWFVSMIFLFYLIYPIVVFYSKKFSSLVICLLVIFITFAALRFFFGMIDIRFFEYFPVFIFGIIAMKNRLFFDMQFKKFVILSSIPLIIIALLFLPGFVFAFNNPIFHYFIITVFLIWISILGYYAARFCIPYLKKNVQASISKIAYSSYAIYLFHLPLLALLLALLKCVLNNYLIIDFLIIFFGFPFSIITGYFIQYNFDRTMRKLSPNRSRNGL